MDRRLPGGRKQLRKHLEQKNHRSGECPQKGKPVASADHEVEEHHRPAQKNQHFKEICERAASDGLSAHLQERRLQRESGEHDHEVPPGGPRHARTQRIHGVGEPAEKTNGGCNQEPAFHRTANVGEGVPFWQMLRSTRLFAPSRRPLLSPPKAPTSLECWMSKVGCWMLI